MSPAAWIAFAGVIMALVVQTIGLAFWLGGMSARLRNVESKNPDDCSSQLAAMNATLIAMEKGVERRFADLEHTVRDLLSGTAARRRRASE